MNLERSHYGDECQWLVQYAAAPAFPLLLQGTHEAMPVGVLA